MTYRDTTKAILVAAGVLFVGLTYSAFVQHLWDHGDRLTVEQHVVNLEDRVAELSARVDRIEWDLAARDMWSAPCVACGQTISSLGRRKTIRMT